MKTLYLYKYVRDDGGVSVSLNNPSPKPFKNMYRLVADEGKILYKGNTETYCVDIETNDYNNWSEKDAPLIDETEGNEQ